jgi:hypothetical protein
VTKLRKFLVASAFLVACSLFMAFAVSSQVHGALAVVPLAVSTTVFLLSLAFYGAGRARPAFAGRRQQASVRRPQILTRKPAPLCVGCEVAEAVSSGDRQRIDMLRSMAALGFLGDPYESHRDCWVSTGDDKELARMLRHVTWTPS